MKFLGLICVLLLGACAGDPSTPQGQCEKQAYDDPAVRASIAKGTSGGGELDQDLLARRKYLIQDATNRCLMAKGVIRGGGVERMKLR